MQLSGDVIGIVECEANGYFTGDYSVISYNNLNEKVVTKHSGSVRFDGRPTHLRLNGNFQGTLSNGTVGNVDTNSAFILKNGMYKAIKRLNSVASILGHPDLFNDITERTRFGVMYLSNTRLKLLILRIYGESRV